MIVLDVVANNIDKVHILFVLNSVQFFDLSEFVFSKIDLLQTQKVLNTLKWVNTAIYNGESLYFFEGVQVVRQKGDKLWKRYSLSI